MSIQLPSRLEELVNRLVATGQFASADEVVAVALAEWEERERLRSALRQDIADAVAEADAGVLAPIDFEAIKSQARARFAGERSV